MTVFSFSSYFRSKQTPGIRAILSQCEITCDLDQGEIVIKAKNRSFAEALLLADFTNTLNLNIRLTARGFNRVKLTKRSLAS